MNQRAAIRAQVARFYDELPFNSSSAAESARRIAAVDQLRGFPDLRALLTGKRPAHVLDLGCGTGWFPLTLAVHHGLPTVAVDLSATALACARATAAELEVADRVEFVQADLFAFAAGCSWRFDIVNSIGVLHHTGDTEAGLRAAARLTRVGGYLHVGLYHLHGRAPFRALFDGLEIDEAYTLYRSLHSGLADELLLRSWFRDQVLHPFETQHTLAEIDAILHSERMELRSTSLCGFKRPIDKRLLFAEEPRQRALSERRNLRERTYFPGFFTALYRRGEA
jgi:SAM-dependent methyltransferase